jgi:hypothetical protein
VTDDPIFSGGCLCGAVRFRAAGRPGIVTHCHCGMCRRASGAPFVTWAAFPRAGFVFDRGTPTTYRSSANAERQFCPTCGTQLTFRYLDDDASIDVTVATLDNPALVTPQDHIWTEAQLPWIRCDDGLPRLRRGHRDS